MRKVLKTTLSAARAAALPILLAILGAVGISGLLARGAPAPAIPLATWRLVLAALVVIIAVVALGQALLQARTQGRLSEVGQLVQEWIDATRLSGESVRLRTAAARFAQGLKEILKADAVLVWEAAPGGSVQLLAGTSASSSSVVDESPAIEDNQPLADEVSHLILGVRPEAATARPIEASLASFPRMRTYLIPVTSAGWGWMGALTIHRRHPLTARSTVGSLVASLLPKVAEAFAARREAAVRRAEGQIALRLAGASERAPGLADALGCLCMLQGWLAGEIGLNDLPNGGYRRVAAWHADDTRIAHWLASEDSPPEPARNLPAGSEMLWQEDLAQLFDAERSRGAAECGITAAMILPLLAGDRPLGMILAYGKAADRPAPAFLSPLQEIGRWFGEALFRWKALELLRRQERSLDELIEGAAIGLGEIASSGTVLWVNPTFARMLGGTPSEVVGRHVAEFMADPGQVSSLLQAIHDRGLSSRLDARMHGIDGRLWQARISIAAWGQSGGERIARCTILDISADWAWEIELREEASGHERRAEELAEELKRLNQELLTQAELRLEAEADLQRQEARFQALIEQAPGFMLVLNGEGKIEFASAGAETRLGDSPGGLMGKSLFDLTHPDDLVPTTAAFQRLVQQAGRRETLEFRLRDLRGGWQEYVVAATGRLDDPRIHGVVMSLRQETERKRSEAALRETEERFRLLAEGVEDYALYLLDPEGRVVSWNAGASRIKGYAPEEVLGKHFALFYTPEDNRQGQPSRDLEMARREGRLQSQGWRVRKDGTRFWAELVVTPLYDERRNLKGFAKLTRDITVLRDAEEQLRRRERQMAAAQQISHTGSWEWDLSANQMNWSEEMGRIYGVDPSDFRPTYEAYLDRTLPEDRDRVIRSLKQCRKDRQPFEYERRIVLPDGSTRVLLTHGTVEADERGVPVRVIGADQDITEHKQMEDTVRTQRELYLSLLSAQSDVGEGVLLIDGDRVAYANAALEAFFGLDEDTRQTLEALLDRIDPGRVSRLRKELEARRHVALPPARGQVTFRQADGSQLELEYIIKTTSIGDRSQSFVLVRDVTERHRTETELRSSREQLRAFSSQLSRAREEESSRIAREIHDELGQRLTGLKMDTSWLASRLRGLGTEVGDGLATKTRAMSELVDDTIRQVRRIATELRPGLLDDLGLTAALEWQADEFQQRTGIRCVVQAPSELPGLTPDQSTALFRIGQEALTNVARHAQAKNVEITLVCDDAEIVLTVRDDGKGISDRDADGASLGLLGMAERARLLGGETRVERAKPSGTVVQVRLPRVPRSEEPQ